MISKSTGIGINLTAMAFTLIRRIFLVATLALSAGSVAGKAGAASEVEPAEQPTSLLGSYLAGRSADGANDLDAALKYLNYTLEIDRGFPGLTQRVLMLRLAAGEIKAASELAEKILITDAGNPIARLTLAVSAIRSGDYELAKRELDGTRNSPLSSLTAGLLDAWADQGLTMTDSALATVEKLSGPAWYTIFKDYHSALIADLAGQAAEAETAITEAFGNDPSALGVVEAYARIKARNGENEEALRAVIEFDENTSGNPIIKALVAQLEAGTELAPIVTTAQSGAAEVLYGLGTAFGADDGTRIAAAYLQMAHFLDPSIGVVSMALGDLFHRSDECEKAIEIYQRVPQASPVRRNAAIQAGICLDTIGRTDEGASQIKEVVDSDPSDVAAAIALGNIYRNHDRFAEAAGAYTAGINAFADSAADPDWRIYYFRGVSYERTKRWPEAEADFKHALDLNPDQPQVLNYLGYSWVDQGLNLEEALDMIRTAVELRPTDGYIIDSLGWAYYRLGRYQDAVDQLERAVEHRPDDAVINDHLGDAYWQVERRREAKFQWAHARDLEPEETELPIILNKIENGLTDEPLDVD